MSSIPTADTLHVSVRGLVTSTSNGQSGLPTRAQPYSDASALRRTAASGPTTLPAASSRYIFSLTSYRTASADLMSGRSVEAELGGRHPRPDTRVRPSAA